ncbi:MAG: hydantoinase B/oxoprolinase family protein, partial [Gaiellales bacterium]
MSRDEYARRWASLADGYVPPDELAIPAGLALHGEHEEEIDPITYEVLRSRLWSINEDHLNTVRRISGSGVTVYVWDLNTSIQTELGDGIVFGPGILFFAGCADLVVKWTLEHRAGNVGIREGDVFVQDDPWVGTNHQMDVAVYAPVFVDKRLFCWVYNCVHQQELGGVEPGGFVQQAPDTYWEATAFPPMKLVEDGTWREDLVDAWIRRSRLPELCHLELKSQVSGVEFARARVTAAIDDYGPSIVKGVMRRMIDNTERVVRRRLASIPDGRWRDVRYCAGGLPDDRTLHRLELTIAKRGSTLTFSNAGTDDTYGSFNIPVGVWRGAVLNAALPLLAHDQYLCGAGVLRCLRFEPRLGSITSARHPSAVSTSLGTTNAISQAMHLISKMLGSSEGERRSMLAACAHHTQVYTQMFGTDQTGAPYANFPFDGIGGGTGAFSFRDGIDHGGSIISPRLGIGSVEEWERVIPFLYLYRREVAGGGGHGRWRGGAGIVTGWTGHKTDASFISSGGLFQSATQGHGLSGGYPGTGGTFWSATATTIADALAAGRLPASPPELRELAPSGGAPPPKKFDNPLASGHLFEVMPPMGGGHGDPLLREPARVARDVAAGRLAPDDAHRIYGVAVERDGASSDEDETETIRASIRAARLAQARQPEQRRGKADPSARRAGRAIETVAIVVQADAV